MKVGIIGAGNVGIGVLDSLVYLGIPKEIVLFNRTLKKAEGEILDLEDSLPFLNDMKLSATKNYNNLKECDNTEKEKLKNSINKLDEVYQSLK